MIVGAPMNVANGALRASLLALALLLLPACGGSPTGLLLTVEVTDQLVPGSDYNAIHVAVEGKGEPEGESLEIAEGVGERDGSLYRYTFLVLQGRTVQGKVNLSVRLQKDGVVLPRGDERVTNISFVQGAVVEVSVRFANP